MHRVVRFLAGALVAGLAGTASAQGVAASTNAPPPADTAGAAAATGRAANAAPSFAPRVEHLTAGVRAPISPPPGMPAPAPTAPPPNLSSTSKMVFGGAAIIVGAVIGGDAGRIIVVGGAVVLLWGLYQYLH